MIRTSGRISLSIAVSRENCALRYSVWITGDPELTNPTELVRPENWRHADFLVLNLRTEKLSVIMHFLGEAKIDEISGGRT